MDARPVDVVFFHGAGDGAFEADSLLAGSLARHLGDGFSVTVPRLPDDDDGDDSAWLRVIDESIDRAKPPLVLVGHSAGGYLLLKALAARGPGASVAVVGIIAAPYPGGDPDWTFDGFELPADLADRLPASAEVLLYASEDDEVVPFAHRDLYAAALPRVITRTTTGGHQLGDDLALVAADIRARLRRPRPTYPSPGRTLR